MNTTISHKDINDGGNAIAITQQSAIELVQKAFCPKCSGTLLLEATQTAMIVHITITCKQRCGYIARTPFHARHTLEDKERMQGLPLDCVLISVENNQQEHLKGFADMMSCACLDPLSIFFCCLLVCDI